MSVEESVSHTKQCSICGAIKPITDFARCRGGWQSYCKACHAIRQARYRQQYPERKIAYDEQWRAANQDHKREYNQAWHEAHPGRGSFYSRIYIERKRDNGGSFTKEQFRELCEAFGDCCVCCGTDGPLQSDHIVPVSRGGSNDISNIQPLCSNCNRKKHTKVIDYRRERVVGR